MAISSTLYLSTDEIDLVEVCVNGKSVGICAEGSEKDLVAAVLGVAVH